MISCSTLGPPTYTFTAERVVITLGHCTSPRTASMRSHQTVIRFTMVPQRNSPTTRAPCFRHDSESHEHDEDDSSDHAQRRWSMLRSRVVPARAASGSAGGPAKVSALAPTAVASLLVTTELLAGQLPVMILKTWLDRDEDGNKAVPVLLGSLRFRVGDSVGLRQGGQTGREMFKIECEYGDGAVKWVIYRELRDFLSLHAHYKAANFGTRVTSLRSSRHVEIPEFPKMSLPYWKGRDNRSYAQASRDALQQYLVELIRAVLFRPESNRLCKFFELSALTLALAPRGGFQGKAGFIRILSSAASRRANQPGLTPTSWLHHREPKWFVVRDSYFVAADGPEATDLYDVFLLDTDFSIERPKRAYRTGLSLLSGGHVKSIKGRKELGADAEKIVGSMVDHSNPAAVAIAQGAGEGEGQHADEMQDEEEAKASQHTFYITNSQRKLKLVAKNARDYFWNLSRAMNMAKDRIYIHDWWLSPELYLRRPGDERYRLDNLLKRKAEEGVRVFVIIYNEVSDKTTPVDSLYTKRRLTGLHPNIMVQRSPSHFQTGTFYWSHHEKLCVIDETIAFMGGLDLCYARWDTSQHIMTDEDYTVPDGPDGPVWRGKDYFNERVAEFANLDKPFEDTFDRSKVPRMPWHDVGLQIVGQPARDLCRHFVQRWNLLIRTKNHTRRLPFLLPPSDFTERELSELKLNGTCEVQICRSCGPWSIGTPTKIEHSIQNAYIKSIQLSEHFVYIENQFFITSTVVDGIRIENGIGDALVERITRAHRDGTPWRACIVIPLLPGYSYPIDSSEASSVRLILECQNRTISRGTHSIFSRLRKEGVDPDDYITFFSLRGWTKFKSGALTTEQVYIHGKTMVVDDRLVLCGSANINERSQRGDRDSELVAVIRDTDMIDGTMAGQPYKVGRFAHTLRMRLMREHVGIDVDAIDEDQLMSRKPVADADDVETWDPDHEQEGEGEHEQGVTRIKRTTARDRLMATFENGLGSVTKGLSENTISNVKKVADKAIHPIQAVAQGNVMVASSNGDPSERRDYAPGGKAEQGFASSLVPTLEEKTIFERRPSGKHANGRPLFDLLENDQAGDNLHEAEVPSEVKQTDVIADDNPDAKVGGAPVARGEPGDKEKFGVPADADPAEDELARGGSDKEQAAVDARKVLRKHLEAQVKADPWNMPTPTPKINPNRFHDPLDERFWKDMWTAVAVHNPDDLVTSWASYKAFANHAEKFNKVPQDIVHSGSEPVKVTHADGGTHGAGGGGSGGGIVGQEGGQGSSETRQSDVGDTKADSSKAERRSSGEEEAWHEWEMKEMEKLLNEVRGHLVIYPTRFLEAEDMANNFLFNSDKILPLPIYD
ncbi:Phospholipase D1 [Cryptotrichosporon argae]